MHTNVASPPINLRAFGIYRPQAELSGGRSGGKFVAVLVRGEEFQILISAGDN